MKILLRFSHTVYFFIASLLIILFVPVKSGAQFQNTPEGRLALLCKTWGMVKYHHTQVKIGNVNWDSVLLAHVINVKNAPTLVDFNNEINSLIDAAGNMQLTLSPSVPNMPVNVDFSWIPDPMLDPTVQWKLNFIKNNFVADSNYYVTYSSFTIGFPHDDYNLPNDTFPPVDERFLYMFKYWNIYNYYFPYRPDMDSLWDRSLVELIPAFDTAASALDYHLAFSRLVTRVNDTHAGFIRSDILDDHWKLYEQCAPVYLMRANGQTIVARLYDTIPGLHEGDIIHKINGMDIDSLRTDFRQYFSASNDDVGDAIALVRMLPYYGQPFIQFEAEDSTGAISTVTANPTYNFFTLYNDIMGCEWCGPAYQLTTCGYGYVNMNKLQPAQVNAMYTALQNAPAIIFDSRGHSQNGIVWDICNKLFDNNVVFSRGHIPIVDFPGDYSVIFDNIGIPGNPTPYMGKVYILINELTLSQGETGAMMLRQIPNASLVKVIGNRTAGSDGNVGSFYFPGNIVFHLTGMAIFYPDSTVTQRVGIIPDTVVIPTSAGIRQGVDEVLMAAFDCLTGLEDQENTEPDFQIYPNPGYGIFNLNFNNIENVEINISVSDIAGSIIFTREYRNHETPISEIIDLSKAADGVYLLKAIMGNRIVSRKLIITHY